MNMQRERGQAIMEEYIGKTLRVLVSEVEADEDSGYSCVGRAWFQSDMDSVVIFSGDKLRPGDFTEVLIDDVIDLDLYGYQQR
ncbi:MAG: TRAM domain-containing protein, partial [Candidatus Cloacimonadaceae bacterium]|nr:TRAM domain-containing protein [Candidatus Cloacimonadaceae bacterium]